MSLHCIRIITCTNAQLFMKGGGVERPISLLGEGDIASKKLGGKVSIAGHYHSHT